MKYTIQSSDASTRIFLYGALMFDNHATFRELLDSLPSGGPSVWDFDLSEVSSIDSSGVGMLLLAADVAKERGTSVKLTSATGAVHRVLTLCGLDQLVEFG